MSKPEVVVWPQTIYRGGPDEDEDVYRIYIYVQKAIFKQARYYSTKSYAIRRAKSIAAELGLKVRVES